MKLLAMWIAPLSLCVSGCTTIQLVSNYDENTDKGASELQKKISDAIVGWQSTNIPSDRMFAKNQKFYQDAVVDINGLQVRAQGIYKNSLTIEQLQLIEDNIAYLALLHKGCVTGQLGEFQKKAVLESGVDTTLACRVSYGASFDSDDRGGQVINPSLLGPLNRIFEQSLGAVIALELAKKRGDGDKK